MRRSRGVFCSRGMRLAGVLAALAVIGSPATTAEAQNSLTPHSAVYKIKISVLGGQLNTQLEATEQGYVATHAIKATGIAKMFARGHRNESSEFYAVADGVRPTKFHVDDTMSREKMRASIEFDWDTGEVHGTVNGEKVSSTLQGIAYDHVSIQYELMHDLMNGGTSAEYTMFEIDKLRVVSVHNIGRKNVKVPAGKFDAIGIQHQAAGSQRITTLWCVEELDFLPVIIEQHRKGKLKFRATLKRYSAAAGADRSGQSDG